MTLLLADVKKDIPRVWDIPSQTGPCTLRYFTHDLGQDPQTFKDYALLVEVCEAGDASQVRRLLRADRGENLLNLAKRVTSLYTPLEAGSAYPEIVQILLDAGVAPIEFDFERASRLVCSGKLTQQVLDLLVQKGLWLGHTDPYDAGTLLHFACAHGAPRPVIDLLLANGVTPDVEEATYEWSPLRNAIRNHKDYSTQENLDFVRWLLRKPEFQRAFDIHGNQPLHYAAMEGDIQVADILLKEFKADINQANDFGHTPLSVALKSGLHGGLSLVPILLKAGASATATDNLNRTPLHIAIEYSDNDIAVEFCVRPEDLVRMVFDAWVAEAGYRRPNVLFVAAARLKDIKLMKELLPLCQEDEDLKELKKMIDFIRAALSDEGKCIGILEQVSWSDLNPRLSYIEAI
ncbi:ankyrin repeat-containing domain protein [Aspergillus granulosus]|uniref:Ankyrin repeat-containing domain protein n=1 Tax=Aspergillus granulosus TaxID=176169 RepID=A0ABR4GUM5_9EURO